MDTRSPQSGFEAPSSSSAIRTFLIADLRGYTRFVDQRGDEAAARLTERFAAVASEVVAARSGEAAAEVGFTWWQMHQLYHGSEWSLALGRTGKAEAYGRDALRLAVAVQDRQLIVYLLAILAGTAAAQGHLEKAGAVWGAVEAEEGRGRVGQWEGERDVYAARVLDHENEAFATGRVNGRRMTLSDAVDYALADID